MARSSIQELVKVIESYASHSGRGESRDPVDLLQRAISKTERPFNHCVGDPRWGELVVDDMSIDLLPIFGRSGRGRHYCMKNSTYYRR